MVNNNIQNRSSSQFDCRFKKLAGLFMFTWCVICHPLASTHPFKLLLTSPIRYPGPSTVFEPESKPMTTFLFWFAICHLPNEFLDPT